MRRPSAKIITEWRQKEFLAEISGKVVSNMDSACQYAVEQAQDRAPVRSGIMRADITYEIVVVGLVVTGWVGVLVKRFYAYFVELGTSRMKAQPFLRPAIFNNARQIVRRLTGG